MKISIGFATIFFSFFLCSAPALAQSILDQANAIETRMDSVKPVFKNSMVAPDMNVSSDLAEQQGRIVDDVIDLIQEGARKGKSLDQKSLEALVHLMARAYLYDGMGQVFEENSPFIKKNLNRIEQVLTKMQNQRIPFERNEPFDEGRIEKVRFQLGLVTGSIRSTSSEPNSVPPKNVKKK